VKVKYVVAGAVVSAAVSGALAANEARIREEAEKRGIAVTIIPWSMIAPWAIGILAYIIGYAARNDAAKSFGAGSLIYAGSSLVNRISTAAAYRTLGGGK
jgi:hypothetical protein